MRKQSIKWLSYPKNKPRNASPVLVTYNWKGFIQDEYDDFEVGMSEYWEEDNGFGKWDKYVIAFAELPEPYKGEK